MCIRDRLDIRLSATTIEVLHQNRRVATHIRSYIQGAFTTDPAHRPKSHQKYLEWTPSRIISWAASKAVSYTHLDVYKRQLLPYRASVPALNKSLLQTLLYRILTTPRLNRQFHQSPRLCQSICPDCFNTLPIRCGCNILIFFAEFDLRQMADGHSVVEYRQ